MRHKSEVIVFKEIMVLLLQVLKLREILRDKKFSLMKNFPAGYDEVKDIAASYKSDTNSILILVLLTTHCMILNKPEKKKKNQQNTLRTTVLIFENENKSKVFLRFKHHRILTCTE